MNRFVLVLFLAVAVSGQSTRNVNPKYLGFQFQTWKLGVLYTPKILVTSSTQDEFAKVSGGKPYAAFVRSTALAFLSRGTSFLHVEDIDSTFDLVDRCEKIGNATVCLKFPKSLTGFLRSTGIRFVLVIDNFTSHAGHGVLAYEEGIPLEALTETRRGPVDMDDPQERAVAGVGIGNQSTAYKIYNGFRFAVYDTEDSTFLVVGSVGNEDTSLKPAVVDWQKCLYRCFDEVTNKTPFRVDFPW